MSAKNDKPEVSIIVLNLNGKHHLDRCFTSLREMNYDLDKVERILVDNGSIDDSVRFMNSRFPEVRVIVNQQNLGFAPACNLGARAARGDILVFLNNDIRVDPEFLHPLVDAVRSGETDCASSLLLSWDGNRVNFGGAGSNFHGIGFQEGMDDENVDNYRTRKDILFACGGSMAISKKVFFDAGGFDDDFFAYFEDVDLGWRLWVLGYKVRFIPESIAYHHHHGTSRLIGIHKIRLLYIRNPLYMIFKNYNQENLLKTLPAALLLSMKRAQYLLPLTDGEYRIDGRETRVKGFLGEKVVKAKTALTQAKVTRAGLADVLALCDFTDNFQRVLEKRKVIQAARKRDDSEILPMFKNPFWAVEEPPEFGEALDLMAEFFGFSGIFDKK